MFLSLIDSGYGGGRGGYDDRGSYGGGGGKFDVKQVHLAAFFLFIARKFALSALIASDDFYMRILFSLLGYGGGGGGRGSYDDRSGYGGKQSCSLIDLSLIFLCVKIYTFRSLIIIIHFVLLLRWASLKAVAGTTMAAIMEEADTKVG